MRKISYLFTNIIGEKAGYYLGDELIVETSRKTKAAKRACLLDCIKRTGTHPRDIMFKVDGQYLHFIGRGVK